MAIEPVDIVPPSGVVFTDGAPHQARYREHLMEADGPTESASLMEAKGALINRYRSWLANYCAARNAATVEWRVRPELAVKTKAGLARLCIYSRFAVFPAAA